MNKNRRLWRHLLWVVPALILAGGAVYAMRMMQPPPADLDLSLKKPTDGGLYIAAISADVSPVAVGPMHSWTVTVTEPDGTPVEGATIGFDGGMPQHGHGLPSAPQMTAELGNGRYQIDGMKFNMPGWWTLTVTVDASEGADQATFNLTL